MFTRCPIDQASTPPSSRSPSRRPWRRVWRSWQLWAGRCSWATARRCSTAPPRRCAPRLCRSIPACSRPWAWMPSCVSLTRPPPPVSTCRTSKSSRSSGECEVMLDNPFYIPLCFMNLYKNYISTPAVNQSFCPCVTSEGPSMTVRWWRVWCWTRGWPTAV